jgi:hypothetical protein
MQTKLRKRHEFFTKLRRRHCIKSGKHCTSRDSSVSTALGYGVDERGSRVRFPAGAGNFSLHHRVQNGSGAYPASYPMGIRGFFPGGWSGRCVKLTTQFHLMPRSRMRGAIPPLPQYVFMAWCFVKYRDSFTFTWKALLLREKSQDSHPYEKENG